jgi:hypothetical protein
MVSPSLHGAYPVAVAEHHLEIVEGAGAGRTLAVGGVAELGREGALSLDDPLVSRRHARLTVVDQGAVVEDLGSRNGTFVNGQQVHGPTALRDGDTLQVGTTVLKLRAGTTEGGTTAIVAVPAGLLGVAPPVAPAPAGEERAMAPVHRLLDRRVKHQARTAPIAILVLVILVVLVVLALRAL